MHAAATSAAVRAPESDVETAIARLSERFGPRLSTGAAIREQHASVVTWIAAEPPDAVAFPRDTEEVAEIVRICAEHRAPIIPFGAGSSLEGHVNAPFGGVSISTAQMTEIVAVHAEDLDAVVQPGVTRKALNAHLRDAGLFFPIDPGADASIGGMAATRASGTNAVRYGTMKDAVLGLTVVTASGEVMRTGGRAKKSSAGYDLTRLFVGSEGTLGVIAEVTLRLHGSPEAVAGGVCPFPNVRAACDAAILTIQTGLPIARIELLDAAMVAATNAYSRLALPVAPTLFVEFHGTDASVHEQSERFGEIAADLGGGPLDWTTKAEDRTRLWTARHDATWAAAALRSGAKPVPTDVCVPISRLADCVEETIEDIARSGLVAPIVGHVGDGNFHVLPLVKPEDAGERAACAAFISRLVERALRMGGTSTGEHGIGQGKMAYLEAEHGAAAVEAMRALKRALDPFNIMNPGKIVIP
ncbi:FAD-binding oxidoreductase [Chenggangzhangella methanolivorans]|uniref:D-lactate dehydrogenase (cytochrome) n=1 Tax=Chenggangzhangella methanolivorans TaxID=1437009 RepID=A0A9E6RGR6_9HYPH|nr:FAD-linked oxidase C-terminal domain-containing protein [Chenggangzhangella methanolivorans]QZO00727.1 FAD-binding protein [Chenggangzhangella methanolivorans]